MIEGNMLNQSPNQWRKSSHSDAEGQCVEVAATDQAVYVRDSKNPDGPMLTFPAGPWRALLDGIRAGARDL